MSQLRIALLAVMMVGLPARASDGPRDDGPEDESEAPETDEDQDEDVDEPPEEPSPPMTRSSSTTGRPLAVPGPRDQPPLNTTRPVPARSPDGGPARTPEAPSSSDEGPLPPPSQMGHFDVGYRRLWFANRQIPIGERLGDKPHLVHAAGNLLLDKSLLVGASFETTIDPLAGSFPFVLDVKMGWWDGAFGGAQPRGPLRTLPGTRMTYVGWRIIHDHYRGAGGEWSGRASAAGLVAGYAYSAPLGRLTVTTDSQFTLYLLGWKGRNQLPVGLLNQRLSIGFDPLFIDVRFRSDPGTGEELSVGLSLQGLFGLERRKGES